MKVKDLAKKSCLCHNSSSDINEYLEHDLLTGHVDTNQQLEHDRLTGCVRQILTKSEMISRFPTIISG